ncbi:MAG: molecular chaperone TorD family protein [Candidatus Omnitrophica bacterium]|nr:molecular chaperone TorD family protein [Candidatus Omnitrophota bacterium]
MSAELEEKTAVYFLFSRLFREAPDGALLRSVTEQKLLTLAFCFSGDAVPGNTTILEDPDWPARVDDIAVEYTSLFVAPGEKAVSPYESYYCDRLTIDTSTANSCYFRSESLPEGMKGFLGGESAVQVQTIYEAEGFRKVTAFHELPDHAACELEFMGRMLQAGKEDAAEAFFKEHLGRWIFVFLNHLTKQTVSNFYQKVALSLERFIQREETQQ